jgi:hypothetical protein
LIGTVTHTWTTLGGTYYVNAYTEWDLESPIYPDGRALWYYRYVSATGKYRVKNVHTIKYHATEAAALAEIDGGEDGSTIDRICYGCWMSLKMTRNDELLATTTFPDPYEALRTA